MSHLAITSTEGWGEQHLLLHALNINEKVNEVRDSLALRLSNSHGREVLIVLNEVRDHLRGREVLVREAVAAK